MSADKPEGSGADGRITPEDIRAKAESLAGGVEGSVQAAKPILMYAPRWAGRCSSCSFPTGWAAVEGAGARPSSNRRG